jgi:cell division transport system ATP-binding protein
MIRFEHVSKAYLGGRQAAAVTFHHATGRDGLLTGHSGAGKSTLLKLICGIERPSAGKIVFGGHDITRLKNRSAVSASADRDDFPGSPFADGQDGL